MAADFVDQAIDEIGNKLMEVRQKSGPESVYWLGSASSPTRSIGKILFDFSSVRAGAEPEILHLSQSARRHTRAPTHEPSHHPANAHQWCCFGCQFGREFGRAGQPVSAARPVTVGNQAKDAGLFLNKTSS